MDIADPSRYPTWWVVFTTEHAAVYIAGGGAVKIASRRRWVK